MAEICGKSTSKACAKRTGDAVIVAMSGGVDSSVAAYLLKEAGYSVTGVTMRLCEEYCDTDENGNSLEFTDEDADPEAIDAGTNLELARGIAEKLDIGFMSVDYRNEFQDFVIKPFVDAYEKGLTPNPCIECNKYIKFSYLLNDSDEGYELDPKHAPKLATGHYARIKVPAEESGAAASGDGHTDVNPPVSPGRYKLRKAADLSKDQSYFLYSLDQDTLSRVLFPLGELTKDEVRIIADEQGFANARRKDSQDICFIPNGDYYDFICGYTGEDYPEGNFVDTHGNVLGRHRGIIRYTVGQRKGLGLSLRQPMYVYRLDMDKNEVVLASDEELYTAKLSASDFNWVSMDCPEKSFRALGRIRYRHKEAPCTVTPVGPDKIMLVFDEPQRAITAGQSLVLYDIETDSYVLGGGIID